MGAKVSSQAMGKASCRGADDQRRLDEVPRPVEHAPSEAHLAALGARAATAALKRSTDARVTSGPISTLSSSGRRS